MTNSVMLVDDDPGLRLLLKQMLELGGYVVSEAEDGLDALEQLEESLPDALILDVMMPNMDGITLCKRLRQEPATAGLPIIMLSGKTQAAAIEAGLQAGATMYVCKPVAFGELIQHLRDVLGKADTVLPRPGR